MKMRLLIVLCMAMTGLMSIAACGDIATHEVMAPRLPLGAGGSGDLSGDITFSGEIQPILIEHCSLCHSGSSAAGGLDVTSYDTLVNVSDVVVPGDADASEIIQFLEGGVMPLGKCGHWMRSSMSSQGTWSCTATMGLPGSPG